MTIEWDDVNDALLEYSDYRETGSLSRAKAYVTAATRWLAFAGSSSNQGSSLSMNVQQIADELKEAKAFVAANTAGQAFAVKFISVENSR